MGNVASWSGSKTLTCFQYYDQVMADFIDPERKKIHSNIYVNWASIQNSGKGPTIDPPTTRGPFKNIENEGYPSQHQFYPFAGKNKD